MNRVPNNVRRFGRQDGIAWPAVIAAIVIIVLFALAAWWFIFNSRGGEQVPVPPPQNSSLAAAASVAAPPPDVGAMGVGELLDEADKSMSAGRIIAPAGNNAFEFYLKVLEKQPGNGMAQAALRETFPYAASAVEQDIDANNFAEAQREIELLSKADPGNYTLTILRSKLDAQRKLAARAEEQAKLAEQRQQQAEALASQQQQEQDSASDAQSESQAESLPQEQPQESIVRQPESEPEPEFIPEPEPTVVPQPAGPTRGPVLVKRVQPQYPRVAARRRLEGWVLLGFKVDQQGNVVDVSVLDSRRGRVFERAAISALQQWKYRPALKNGKPVESEQLQQPINFEF